MREAMESGLPHVVITGGEPLLQQRGLRKLIVELRKAGLSVQIESNATIEPSELLDVDFELTLSPKITRDYYVADPNKVARIVEKYNVIEIKLVVRPNEVSDAEKFMREVERLSVKAKKIPLIIQPLHEGNYAEESKKVVMAVLRNEYLKRRARVIPQLHKLIGVD